MAEVTTSAASAATALATGHVAALPTETVYGLGANIEYPEAIARVFDIKERPSDHPLIVHVAPGADLHHWVSQIPATAATLVEAFWPGPLTLVLTKNDRVPVSVTGGQNTVALRSPNNPQFLAVLDQLSELTGTPAAIAAPSANLFGQVSPTTAEHVQQGLGSRLTSADVILDGGPCTIGIESTIVLCREQDVVLLRPGGVTKDELANIVTIALSEDKPASQATDQPRVSGTLESHYSPTAQVMVVESANEATHLLTGQAIDSSSIGIIALVSDEIELGTATELARPNDLNAYAAQLYAALRKADDLGLNTVVAVLPPNTGVGVAIRDRLQRAAN